MLPLGSHRFHPEATLWFLQARDKACKRCEGGMHSSGLQLRSCDCWAPDVWELPGNHAHPTAARTEAWARVRAALDPMLY